MEIDVMTYEEQKQLAIDNYVSLMRIKAHETGEKKTVKNIVFDQLRDMGYTVTNWDEVKTLAAEVSAPPYNYVTEREYTGVNTNVINLKNNHRFLTTMLRSCDVFFVRKMYSKYRNILGSENI